MTDLQLLYGLVVSSTFGLQQNRPALADAAVDVNVRWGATVARAEQDEPVRGTPLLHVEWDGAVGYTFVERPDGRCLLRFMGTCDFEISPDLSDVVVGPVEGAERGVAVVLTTGAMLAFQLYRRGHTVLHASAVEVDGVAIGFVAASGGGKSTMAAVMCAAGARLVTDDLLRVDDDGRQPTVRLGTTGLRLRKGADTMLELFDDVGAPERRVSADDRQVLTPAPATEDVPLAALVIPWPDHEARSLEVTRLPAKEALFELLSLPRLLGWQDGAVLQRDLANLSALVSRVPVYRATVPWGPPFSGTLAEELRAALARAAPQAVASGR